MIDPTLSAATRDPQQQATPQSQINADYQSFLKLLTAQVQNQDPLAPMDSSTFVTQLAQLSQVEQSVQVNANLTEISARIAGAVAISDVQLIGRTVAYAGDEIMPAEGGAAFSYELAEEAAELDVRIVSADGTVLRRFGDRAGTGQGTHQLRWDGLDHVGLPVPGDGPFRVEVVATDADGKTVPHATQVTARVESVVFRDGMPLLILEGGAEVASSRIARVE
jgi:flagellar basal-body rod modification protein FlgD